MMMLFCLFRCRVVVSLDSVAADFVVVVVVLLLLVECYSRQQRSVVAPVAAREVHGSFACVANRHPINDASLDQRHPNPLDPTDDRVGLLY